MRYVSLPAGAVVEAPIALVDLGDTLCDVNSALREGLARLNCGQSTSDDSAEVLEAKQRMVMNAPGFWRELEPLPCGFELLELLRAEGFDIYVLTKGPRDAPHAWAEKVQWCRTHVPDLRVVVTDEKAIVFGHVLVEDWLPYIESWQRRWRSGLAVVPARPWNAGALLNQRLLRYDGCNQAEVSTALKACKASLLKL